MKNKFKYFLFFLIFLTSCFQKNLIMKNQTDSKPIVTICIDDGLENTYKVSLPIIREYGYPVTFGIITDYVDSLSSIVTWKQLDTLKNVYHWEIASHSLNHPHLDRLNDTDFINQLVKSKNTLQEHGFLADTFIVPYGAMTVKQLYIAKNYYKNIRFAHNHINIPLIRYQLWAFELDQDASVDKINKRIDTAIEKKEKIIIFYFHNVTNNPQSFWDITPETLEAFLKIIKERDFRVMTLKDAMQNILNDDNYQYF